jgi:hypothetical protein
MDEPINRAQTNALTGREKAGYEGNSKRLPPIVGVLVLPLLQRLLNDGNREVSLSTLVL